MIMNNMALTSEIVYILQMQCVLCCLWRIIAHLNILLSLILCLQNNSLLLVNFVRVQRGGRLWGVHQPFIISSNIH